MGNRGCGMGRGHWSWMMEWQGPCTETDVFPVALFFHFNSPLFVLGLLLCMLLTWHARCQDFSSTNDILLTWYLTLNAGKPQSILALFVPKSLLLMVFFYPFVSSLIPEYASQSATHKYCSIHKIKAHGWRPADCQVAWHPVSYLIWTWSICFLPQLEHVTGWGRWEHNL